ncbi:MAG: insulinase family protein [Firmicutes bacterium]|nr:insulinase family protein [Bacillota bacterium]
MKKESEVTMEVSIPMFVIGIKDCVLTGVARQNMITRHVAIEILLNLLIGKSSNLYKELYETELIMSEPDLDYEFAKSYAYINITGQSKNPRKVLEKLKKEIQNLKENGIEQQTFSRIKNMIYGEYVKEFNNVSDICRMFVSDYFKGINSFDYIEKSSAITLDEVNNVLNSIFLEDKMVLSVVKGKDSS